MECSSFNDDFVLFSWFNSCFSWKNWRRYYVLGFSLWRSKTATVVSGTISEEGIKDCQYAHIVLDTWALNDFYASPLSAPGTYRIWYDGDSLATRLTK